MKLRNRKGLFLCSTILRGTQPRKDENDGAGGKGDGIEVGPGFAAAGDNPDDNRPKPAAEPKADEAAGNDPVDMDADNGSDNGAGDTDDDSGDDGGEDDGEEEKPKKKRDTAKYIRDLKRELRDEKAARAADRLSVEARLSKIEQGGLPNNQGGDNQTPTSEKPDATDATKYPLGVLDDGFINDMIEFAANQKVQEALDGRAQTERREAEEAAQVEHLATLRSKVDEMTAAGSALFDDFEETVLETGMRGEWQLTEATFTAASKRPHGAEILHGLAHDPAEALRVSKLPLDEQVEYVIEKNREIAEKSKGRTKPKAGDPPSNLPRGRNAANPIRADTENLDDFRKLFYKKG